MPLPGSGGATTGPSRPSFHNVLVCTDLSPASTPALHEAARFCRVAGSHLVVLHACQCGLLSKGTEEGIDQVAEQLCRQDGKLQRVADEMRRSGVSVETVLEYGPTSEVILKCMATMHIDLAILGTHGATGTERLFWGSTAEEVLRKASCPVMTVGPRGTVSKADGPRPVIFATDFQSCSTEAVHLASAMAKAAGGPLHCVHVLPLSMDVEGRAPIIPQVMTEALRHMLEQKQVNNADAVCAVTYGSEVSHAIVDYAKAHDAQAIVLGVHRTSWFATHLVPHVTYRIIVTASCPVVTISSEPAKE